MTEDLRRYYEILGISPGASPEDIRQAYRDLATVWHPDRFPNNSRLRQKAQDRLREINQAYARLRPVELAARPATDPRPRPPYEGAAWPGPRPRTRVKARRLDEQHRRWPMAEIVAVLVVLAILAVVAVAGLMLSQLKGAPPAAPAGWQAAPARDPIAVFMPPMQAATATPASHERQAARAPDAPGRPVPLAGRRCPTVTMVQGPGFRKCRPVPL